MNTNNYRDIITIILIIAVIYIIASKNNDQENATNTSATITDSQLTAINNQISQIYNMDVEAIRNLGAISKSLLTGTNYHSTTVGVPGELTIPANNTVFKGNQEIQGNIKVNGNIEFTNKDTLLMDILPRGIILSFNSMNPPLGWTLCNGLNGAPDLRGRFVLGSGQGPNLINRIINTTGGEENHTLTIQEMPSHSHNMFTSDGQVGTGIGENENPHYTGNWSGRSGGYILLAGNGVHNRGKTNNVGDNTPHNNMPPFYVLTYIMKL
jgi:hypothetical protein